MWDAASGAPLGPPLRHESGVNTAAFSPDGTRLVTASADRTARLWDVASGAQIGPPLRHADRVRSAAFSPDGTRVVTAAGSEARLWDAATGVQIGPPLRHESEVNTAAFSPDGTRVLTAAGGIGGPGTAWLWDVRWPKEPITAVACGLLHDRDVTNLADRYGVRIRDAICGPGMPAPDLARLEPG